MGFMSLTALIRGQFKVSRFRSRSSFTFWTKLVILGLLLSAIVFCSLYFSWDIVSSDGLIAGIAIFAGGFLAAFTHLSSVRQVLDARHSTLGAAEAPERDLVDIAVTRLLGATLVSATTAAILVVGTSIAPDEEGHVVGVFAAATWAGSTLSLILFFSAVPALYSAYLQMNRVDPGLDGSKSS
ncbi:hypothetical protein [Cryobacterium sp. N21]|uniref:hypothetical protein n=1 Tax=Cryobacterium sp. N21 TaxID=2048289 RepID=UPI000CE2BB83|nr:hypothetical protein [Cryobacterium sp. N21]